MKLRSITFLCLLISAVSFTHAQDKPILFTNARAAVEHQLTTTDLPLRVGEKQCGPYFILMPHYQGDQKNGILFRYKEVMPDDGDGAIIGIMAQNKFRIILDDSKKLPTLKMVGAGATVDSNTKMVVKISKVDYKMAAGCFPQY